MFWFFKEILYNGEDIGPGKKGPRFEFWCSLFHFILLGQLTTFPILLDYKMGKAILYCVLLWKYVICSRYSGNVTWIGIVMLMIIIRKTRHSAMHFANMQNYSKHSCIISELLLNISSMTNMAMYRESSYP